MLLSGLSKLLHKGQNKELTFLFIYFNNYYSTKHYESRMEEVDNVNNDYNVGSKPLISKISNKNGDNDNEKLCIEKDDDKPEWYEAHEIAIQVMIIRMIFL